jgi:hypothetical protein
MACAAAGIARAAPVEPLDALQQAVVDSLAFPVRTTPHEFLDAAIRAADVDALDVALGYVGRLVEAVDEAGDQRLALLADLGDTGDVAALGRLERKLRPREPAVGKVIAAIREAGGQRRRDPARLAAAARDLSSPDASVRMTAAGRLAAAREDALPALVDLLQSDAPAPGPALARGLVRDLGDAVRQPLLEWLASDDVAHWPGIIAALAASGAGDIETFLLAPAVVADTPPEARAAAVALLQAVAAARGEGPSPPVPPPPADAVARLAARLDRTLSPAGLPEVDHLRLEPVTDPREAAAAFGGFVTGSVERFVWNPQVQRFDRLDLPPRAARVQEAMHLARDLMALAPRDAAAVRLALLARLEATLVFAGDPATALDRIEPARLRDAVSPPEGFSADMVAEVLDLAVTHGMWEAAAAAARTLEPEGGAAAAVLPPAARQALVRALAVPDAALQFAAARALALAAGPPPYAGSSRAVEILAHAATATGVDRAVVAHHRVDVAQELATQVSRFGYEPVVVADGRGAVFAARESADTVLVLLGARTIRPTPLETVQVLQQQGVGSAPPVLVVVDPLDDDGRGCFLEQLLLKFCDVHGIAIVDRLDSFFVPQADPDTGKPGGAPRFPDALAQAGGPRAVDPASRAAAARARLARAREALVLLARLGRRGQDVTASLRTAEAALDHAELRGPALSLLGAIGKAAAQQALFREAGRPDLPEAARRRALAALEASVARHGLVLTSREMLAAYGVYNRATDDESRRAAADVLDVIEAPSRALRPMSADAAPARPTR